MAAYTEAALNAEERDGRAIHLGGDVIGLAYKFIEQARLCLNTAFLGFRDAARQPSDDGAAVARTLFDLPFANTKNIGHILTELPVSRS